jgi:hypothetical protein
MKLQGRFCCDGCFTYLPLAAEKGVDYDSCFGTIWHLKPSCIRAVMLRIGDKLNTPPAA